MTWHGCPSASSRSPGQLGQRRPVAVQPLQDDRRPVAEEASALRPSTRPVTRWPASVACRVYDAAGRTFRRGRSGRPAYGSRSRSSTGRRPRATAAPVRSSGSVRCTCTDDAQTSVRKVRASPASRDSASTLRRRWRRRRWCHRPWCRRRWRRVASPSVPSASPPVGPVRVAADLGAGARADGLDVVVGQRLVVGVLWGGGHGSSWGSGGWSDAAEYRVVAVPRSPRSHPRALSEGHATGLGRCARAAPRTLGTLCRRVGRLPPRTVRSSPPFSPREETSCAWSSLSAATP